jgi:leucyl-tRNA synthetase
MNRYNPNDIEPKWQKKWADDKLYEVTEDSSKPKSYVTAMFPYPSGAGLHVGHVRNYSITDALARFERQNGKYTLTTIGWDGFGLPAENYAIKTGTPPAVSTAANIANFKSQLSRLGMSYDWSRELNTTDPEYYRWTQWIFTKLFERGLAYQKESLQWWCPVDKTVLANEQVEAGKCWRCGNEVIKKSMKQWFFKITDYADELLDGIEDLQWPEKIKTMQRNWIGRSRGAAIRFEIGDETLEVFTTRPDTLFGVTFLVLAPEHPLLEKIATDDHKEAVMNYKNAAIKKSEIERQENKDKTGEFTGAYAINPINGEKIPVWVADYVLMGYGTGAIMAVPAHDERDNEFAKKFDLKIINVVDPISGEKQGDEVEKDAIVAILRNPEDGKILMLDWGPRLERYGGHLFVGGGVDEGEDMVACAEREIAEETGYTNVRHVSTTDWTAHSYYFANVKNKNYYARIRGMVFDLVDDTQVAQNLDEGEDLFTTKWVSEAEAERLVDDNSHRAVFDVLIKGECFHGEGRLANSGEYNGLSTFEARERIVADLEQKQVAEERTNYKMRDWLISRQRYWGAPIPIIHCADHGAVAVPEKDLPVLLPDVKNYEPDGSGKGVLAKETEWLHVPCPTCGKPAERETDTMDGYVDSSWYIFRYADAHNTDKPWDADKVNYWAPLDFYCGGDHAVAHLLYVRFWTRVFRDMGMLNFDEPIRKLVYNGYIYASDGTKMSKSKGNVVDPLEVIESGYGADALRTYELFIGPYEQDTQWDAGGVAGTHRFLSRIWTLVQEFDAADGTGNTGGTATLQRSIHKTVKKVSEDLGRQNFNTAIAAMMECVNELYKVKAEYGYASQAEWRQALTSLVQLLAPFAPHITEELWRQLEQEGSVHIAQWPTYDQKYLVTDTVTIAVQVNGKLRATLQLAADVTEADAVEAAQKDSNVAAHLEGKTLRRAIYVPHKLVNLVVNQPD